MKSRSGRRTATVVAAGLFASAAAVGVALAPAAQAAATSTFGCPSGAVCMYTEDGWWADVPQHIYYDYGFHALQNEWGTRVVFNNQYATSSGRAGAYTCTAASAASCGAVISMGDWRWVDIDPVNYVRLTASGG